MSSLRYDQLHVGDVYEDDLGRIRLYIRPVFYGLDWYPEGRHQAMTLYYPHHPEETGRVFDYSGSRRTMSELGMKMLYRAPETHESE